MTKAEDKYVIDQQYNKVRMFKWIGKETLSELFDTNKRESNMKIVKLQNMRFTREWIHYQEASTINLIIFHKYALDRQYYTLSVESEVRLKGYSE